MSGIDCVVDGGSRDEVREGFSYYTGLSSSRVPRSSAQRRLFLVLNGVQDSTSHDAWQLLYSSQSYGSSSKDEVLGLINSIMPGDGNGGGGDGVTFRDWAADNGLPESSMPEGDDDGDGLTNAIEFYLDTSPTGPTPQPLSIVQTGEAGISVSYAFGQNREGVTVQLEGSDSLSNWASVDVPDDNWIVTSGETKDESMISLPAMDMQFLRLVVSIE